MEGKENLRGARGVGGAVESGCRGHDSYGKTAVIAQDDMLELLELERS